MFGWKLFAVGTAFFSLGNPTVTMQMIALQ